MSAKTHCDAGQARAPGTSQSSREALSENGNLLVLGIGMWVIVLVLIMIVTSAISIHNARKDLFAQADAIALDVASGISDVNYYSMRGEGFRYSGSDVVLLARAEIANLRDDASAPVALAQPTGFQDDVVIVSLEQTIRLPLVPGFMSVPNDVRISVTSHARLREIPSEFP